MGNPEPIRSGIVAIGDYLPEQTRSLAELLVEEQVAPEGGEAALAARLGIPTVHDGGGQTSMAMALIAARRVLERAELDPATLGVVCDFTVLPEDYVVPSWSGANKIQGDLGARRAFTTGYGHGGSTSFLVALKLICGLLDSDDKLGSALLFAGERTLPKNRIIHPAHPLTVLSDGAVAVVVRRGATRHVVLDSELLSMGEQHDIYYVPAGGLVDPLNHDRYRVEFDRAAYLSRVAPVQTETLGRMIDSVLGRAGIKRSDVACFVYPNLAAEDQNAFARAFGIPDDKLCRENLRHGHLQGADLPLNYALAVEQGRIREGDYVLLCSHGLGYMWGVTLIRC